MQEEEGLMFLIVDDEPNMCWALENLLKKEAIVSKQAKLAEDALRLMESNRFTMAFLDLKLPDMDGLELARRIKSIDPAVRIVMVSGYSYRDDEPMRLSLEEGLICDFIAKPFLHADIIRTIKTYGYGKTPSWKTQESAP